MAEKYFRRDFFASFTVRGFSLIEALLIIVIIGIISALLIPKIAQVKEEALRQVARQQVKTFEKALANWYAAQRSLQLASDAWNEHADANGFIKDSDFISLSSNAGDFVGAYLDNTSFAFIPDNNGNFGVTSPEMNQIPVVAIDGNHPTRFIGNNNAAMDVNHAHMRLFWDPAARRTSSPKILFFLPYPSSQ